MLPKRISELATVDSDLDTPDKRTESTAAKNFNRLPKRVADLDIQESDSEDEKKDNLNCAILDDSFILSPSKKLDLGDTPKRKDSESTDENNRNSANVRTTDSGLHTNSEEERSVEAVAKLIVTEDERLKTAFRPLTKSRTQLFPSNSATKPAERSVPSVFRKSSQKLVEPEVRKADVVDFTASESLKAPDIETPYKKIEQHQFATPLMRPAITPFSSATADLSKNPSNLRLQSLTERRDKPQAKILFTTPIARPPPGSLLESTPIELRKPVSLVNRKLSPIKEPSNEKEKPDERLVTINSIDYIISNKIGSGGSSSVYLARGKTSGKEVAIKLVNLDGEQQVIDGYLNETKLLAKLQGNKCVVTLFDYCHKIEKKMLYMVMEKGESDLHKILMSYRTPIPLDKLVGFWIQMLEAVNYIHENGVIHSDLKPANFLMIEGRLKLIDFGIASNIAIDSTSIIKFSQAGTFNYISPEALIDTSVGDSPSTHHQPRIRLSTKSDVWSLGCIFFLLLYKKTPFSHVKAIHQKITILTNPNTVIDYPSLPFFYPPMLVEIVQKCLVYNPKERSSVADLMKYPFEMIISEK